MPVPAGFTQIRSGFIEVGDFIYQPTLAVYLEVYADSSYVGSPVRNHKQVWRNPAKAHAQLMASTVIKSHTDLCDELQEFDSVRLREKNGWGDNYRMVVYKDDQFIYLRRLRNEGADTSSRTSDRVCRRTGKVWSWTAGGWEPYEATLEESPMVSKNLDIAAGLGA